MLIERVVDEDTNNGDGALQIKNLNLSLHHEAIGEFNGAIYVGIVGFYCL